MDFFLKDFGKFTEPIGDSDEDTPKGDEHIRDEIIENESDG